ncbi:MAG: hypothetical protein V7L31_15575 [Nostoc sp.]|uniref:hypothetical protein n=1 Tax=Nostoc sp. TaxID=1180 RepID=UPI002FF1B619
MSKNFNLAREAKGIPDETGTGDWELVFLLITHYLLLITQHLEILPDAIFSVD